MIGDALRLIRVLHDMKSGDLATDLGISASYLSEIEHGRKRPSLEIIAEYSRVFGVKPSTILFFAEELADAEKSARLSGIRSKLLLFMKAVDQFTRLEECTGDLLDRG